MVEAAPEHTLDLKSVSTLVLAGSVSLQEAEEYIAEFRPVYARPPKSDPIALWNWHGRADPLLQAVQQLANAIEKDAHSGRVADLGRLMVAAARLLDTKRSR